MGTYADLIFHHLLFKGIHSPNGDRITAKKTKEIIKKQDLVSLPIKKHGGPDYTQGLFMYRRLSESEFLRGNRILWLRISGPNTWVPHDPRFTQGEHFSYFIHGMKYRATADILQVEKEKRKEAFLDFHMLPIRDQLVEKIYLGDLNGDKRLDLLLVMENGAGLVLYQSKTHSRHQ